MTVETELQKKDPMTDVASVIEYGPVQIGNRIFNCPLRSLTFMTVDPNRCFASRGRTISGAKAQNAPLVFHLNLVTFSNYHRLGSLATILPAD